MHLFLDQEILSKRKEIYMAVEIIALVKGHTLMCCDRGHAQIAIAKSKLKTPIYDMQHLLDIVGGISNVNNINLDIKNVLTFQNTQACQINRSFRNQISKAVSMLIEQTKFGDLEETTAFVHYKLDYRDKEFTSV